MEAKRMFRYEVPVDDQEHGFTLTGPVRAIGGTLMYVEFWYEHDYSATYRQVRFRVFGTGHPVPDYAVYVGTAPRTPEGLVWHLYQMEVK